jgi:RNA polymerase sigma factor for flagellar operon FliA
MLDGVRSVSHLPRRLANQIRALEAARSFSEGAVEDTLQPAPAGSTAADAERALDDHLASMATAMSLGLVANPAAGEDGELGSVSTAASPEEAAQRAELVGRVRAAIAELPEPEGTLLTRHYLEGEQLDVVARELSLSKSWASRLHTRAVSRLTKRLRGLENDP